MNILVVTKNWIGDVVFQLAAIQALRDHYPQAVITCMTPERCLEVLRSHPAVDHLISFDEKTTHRSLLSKIRIVAELRKKKWDKAYLFHRSNTRALLLMLGGVRERIGFGLKRRLFLTRAYPEPHQTGHHADVMLHLLRADRVTVPDRGVYHFYYSSKARDRVAGLLAKHGLHQRAFAAFHLGANWEPKRWPAGHFSVLAEWLHETLGLAVVVTGAATDKPLWEEFKKNIRQARVVSLMGETSLEETGALFRRASFLVTGDSGPMHVASGVGTPVLAVFGPTHPEISGPRGPGAVEVLSFIPEGYKAPWYSSDMPHGGWISRIHPTDVENRLVEKGWGSALKAAGPEPVCERRLLTEQEKKVKRILWVTLSNIGDVIMTTPVLRALAGKFPQAEITAVVSPRAKGVLEKSALIKRIVIYDKKASFWSQRFFLRELRKERYDVVVDLRNTAIPWLVKAKKRSPLLRPFKSLSMRDRHLEVLRLMKINAGQPPAFDFYQEVDEMSVRAKLTAKKIPLDQDKILFAPVAASGLKTWPLEKFERSLEMLLSRTEAVVLIVGDQREREMAAKLEKLNPKRVFNIAGDTTLAEIAALTANALLVVANDSAIMHLAFELGTPAAAVFGPTHHEKYGHKGDNFRVVRAGSMCSPCEEPRCRFERQHCFEDLEPQALVAACEELL